MPTFSFMKGGDIVFINENYVQRDGNDVKWVPAGISFCLDCLSDNMWRLHVNGEYDCFALVKADNIDALVEFLKDDKNAFALLSYYLECAYYHSDGFRPTRWFDVSLKQTQSLKEYLATRR